MPDLSLAPAFAPARVAELVAELWGIEGDLLALPGERDQNFRVTPPRGDAMVVKITSAEEDRALLDAQHDAFQHLRERVGICPRLIPTKTGATVGSIVGASGREHLVRAVAYIPGTPLAELAQVDEPLLEQLGGWLGRLDRALLDFDRTPLRRAFDWDLARGEAVVRRDSPLIADPELRGQIDELLARYVAHTQPWLPRLRRSTIHSDANDHNVIVDPHTHAIVGLIDFGDMIHSWTIGELAIAAAYAVLDRPEPLDVIAALCRGYQAELPLEPAEIEALYGLLCLRLCVSASLFANQIRQRPGDAYLEVSQAPLRRTLPRLLERPFALAREVVHDACTTLHHPRRASTATLLEKRRQHIIPSARLGHANHPVHLRRAWMQYLFDADGRRLLDAYNNVPHVGHCHPHVVAAALAQQRRLSTNTRYIYEALPDYAERLAATLPAPLEVCMFLNSASEANELALRLVRAATGRRDVIVLEHAYHGHTTSLIDISPYKHAGPGGRGAPSWVHVAPLPDLYRGRARGLAAQEAARVYARAVDDRIDELGSGRLAAFIAESCPSVGGQHLLPPGYLAEVYASVRRAGGLTVADEVQTGFGRLGSSFYAFEEHAVIPDVVVLGKPIGNGFPLAAVVTTRAIADAFDDGMEFFSTYGGNPVACEVGMAVLDVLEHEQLQAHAARVGERLLAGLRELADVHACIGDVRGKGLFLGAELVLDRDTRSPDTARASRVVDFMREAGVLIGTDGPDHNVLKIRPPMPFNHADADRLIDTLARALAVDST